MTAQLLIEGVTISPAAKITKSRLMKFENGQTAIARTNGIKDMAISKDKKSNEKESDRVSAEITSSMSATLEFMALSAACFLTFKRGETELSDDEVDVFLDKELDFDEMESVGNMAGERATKFKNDREAKKKSTVKSKKH